MLLRAIIVSIGLFGGVVIGKTLQIGIFADIRSSSVSVTASGTGYWIYAGSEDPVLLEYGKTVKVYASGDEVALSGSSIDGTYTSVRFIKNASSNHFKISSNSPSKSERSYQGDLYISRNGSKLKLINQINIEQYLEGVLRSEAGYGHRLEYYKIQAVISRTFALSNQYKHQDEGYHLCDQVHCQAYKGKLNTSDSIAIGIDETRGEVIVDTDIQLITASFHSNCGGQTCNSEDVWTKALPYLRSVVDTFCVHSLNATWEKSISESSWIDYLDRHEYPTNDSVAYACAISFDQDSRVAYFDECYAAIPLTNIRTDWALKSTYFETSVHEDKIRLQGRGFGHGVGLCQEGAMEMAEQGYSYTDILHFYYTNVHLIDLKYLSFFKED